MGVQAIPFTTFQDLGIEKRNRALRFDINAMADFEQVTGMGLAQLMNTNAIFAATRALLWAGLRWQDRGLTIDYVGQLMQDYMQKNGDVKDLLQPCLEACVKQKAIPNLKLRNDNDEETGNAEGVDPNAPSSQTTGTQTDPGAAGSGPAN